jgi:hypothetical protein
MIDLQDRFTESIVAAIQPRLQQAEVERVKLKAECDFGPYDFLLRAQECEYQFRKEGQDAALRHLEQALALDPSYARAMALAAFCYATGLDQGWMSDQQTETMEGLRLAFRAIHLAKIAQERNGAAGLEPYYCPHVAKASVNAVSPGIPFSMAMMALLPSL